MSKRDVAGVLADALIMDAPMGGVMGVVEMIQSMAQAQKKVANAITGSDLGIGHDANGGAVGCLTEAVMGVTGGLCQIAAAIRAHTEFLREQAEGEP